MNRLSWYRPANRISSFGQFYRKYSVKPAQKELPQSADVVIIGNLTSFSLFFFSFILKQKFFSNVCQVEEVLDVILCIIYPNVELRLCYWNDVN